MPIEHLGKSVVERRVVDRSVFFALSLAAAVMTAGCSRSPAVDGDAGADAGKSSWTTLGNRQHASRSNQVITTNTDAKWVDYNPPTSYDGSTAEDNVSVPMDDGISITLKLVRPTKAGKFSTAPLPTIVTFTPYNKNVGDTIPLGAASIPTLFRMVTTMC